MIEYDVESVVMDPRRAAQLMENDGEIAIDLETTGLNPWRDRVAIIALNGQPSNTTAVIQVRNGQIPTEIKGLIERPSKRFTGHNLVGFDCLMLHTHGVDVKKTKWYDTMVGEMVTLVNGRRDVSLSLKATAKRRTGVEIDKDIDHSQWTVERLSQRQMEYVLSDITLLHDIRGAQVEKVSGKPQFGAMELEMAILPVVIGMTCRGLPIDVPVLNEALDDQRMVAYEEEGYLRQRMGDINFDSPVQLKKALHSLGIPVQSTKFEVLRFIELAGGPAGELCGHIIKRRHAAQRLKMYKPEWQDEHIDRSDLWDFIHARFWQCGTDTGRFSSSNPNLQQVPKDFRYVFGGVPGHKFFSVDYEQIEVRIAAALAGDQAMIEAIKTGDIHTHVASRVYNVPLEQVTPAMRRAAKAGSFTLLFGGGPPTLYEYAKLSGGSMTQDEAYEFSYNFFQEFKGVNQMRLMAQQMARTRRSVMLTLASGLTRLLVGEKLTSTRILNTSVQGTAAAGLKYGILECARAGLDQYLGATVHDELDGWAEDRIADDVGHAVAEAMVKGMQKVIPGDVPIGAELKVGSHWQA